ncbi:MAG TPA: alpha/beta hydrolase-fold protein [Bryobacteraceae bacterium]|nr:alpha/beta hydrolase-fold protein [Bryobacteraceae bacterium]
MHSDGAALVLALSLGALGAYAQRPNGPLSLNFASTVDHSQQPYALYLPPDFDRDTTYPLLVSLHSEESTHRLNFRQLFGASTPFSAVDPLDPRFYPVARDVEYIVAFPLARGTIGYQGIAEDDVYDMLADVERRYSIDVDRVFLTGVSMGGGGALWYALTRPDIWAAVAALAPAAPPDAEALAMNAFNLPVRLLQGLQDPIVAAHSSRDWQRKFEEAGVAVRYFEYPSVRHDIWSVVYKRGAIFDWFSEIKRNLNPERVRFVANCYRYSSAYWVRIDGLTPGTPAIIDARRASAAQITVATQNVDGFTLSAHEPATSIVINGTAIRLKAGAPLSFMRTGAQWRAQRYVSAGKRAGSEGPIAAAFTGTPIYVYGAGAAASAEHAAKWTNGARVLADSAVTAADVEGSDAILFGTEQTNSVIAHLSHDLPLHLNPGAADYGLLFIAPAGAHYVVINSGLPWWTGASEINRGGDRFAPEPYRLVSTFGDYILFKGSLANVIAEGRFDSNWRVPPEAAAKMRATGTVTIR